MCKGFVWFLFYIDASFLNFCWWHWDRVECVICELFQPCLKVPFMRPHSAGRGRVFFSLHINDWLTECHYFDFRLDLKYDFHDRHPWKKERFVGSFSVVTYLTLISKKTQTLDECQSSRLMTSETANETQLMCKQSIQSKFHWALRGNKRTIKPYNTLAFNTKDLLAGWWGCPHPSRKPLWLTTNLIVKMHSQI